MDTRNPVALFNTGFSVIVRGVPSEQKLVGMAWILQRFYLLSISFSILTE